MRRLSGKLDVSESSLLEEFGKWRARASIKRGDFPSKEGHLSASGKELGVINEVYLLNLLAHHPDTVHTLVKCDCRLLISDSAIREIFDFIADLHAREGVVEPSQILEGLDAGATRERFREAMLSPSIFPDDRVDQALKGFENRVLQKKMENSKKKAKEQLDLEALNRVLRFKKERESKIL